MNGMRKMEDAIHNTVNELAVKLVKRSANTACAWTVHQPEFPAEAKQFKNISK